MKKLTDVKLDNGFAMNAMRSVEPLRSGGWHQYECQGGTGGPARRSLQVRKENPLHSSIALGWSNNGKKVTKEMVEDYL